MGRIKAWYHGMVEWIKRQKKFLRFIRILQIWLSNLWYVLGRALNAILFGDPREAIWHRGRVHTENSWAVYAQLKKENGE